VLNDGWKGDFDESRNPNASKQARYHETLGGFQEAISDNFPRLFGPVLPGQVGKTIIFQQIFE